MNSKILRFMILGVHFYLRYCRWNPANRFLFDRVFERVLFHYLRDNPIEVTIETKFHCRMITYPSEFIDRRICFFGVWEPTLTRYIASHLTEGDVFIDVGANIGYYSLLAASVVGSEGKVYSIEASPSIFKKLERNIIINNIRNISCRNVAVVGVAAPVSVYIHAAHNAGHTTVIESEISEYHRFEGMVDGLPLDKILPWSVVETAKFIKIDVEGAEWLIIDSLREKLHSLSERTEFILELTPDAVVQTGGTVEEIIQIFDEAGFDAFRIINSYNTSEYLKDVIPKLTSYIKTNENQMDLVLKKRKRINI